MRDKTNLYAYTHKYKKHNRHNKYNNRIGSDGVFDDRRTEPSLHDITLKMRKMYDAVSGSFSSFNDPSKPFTAIDYRRIHNGWKNKKNGRRGMNRMNRMKRMIGGVTEPTTTPCINENQPTGKTVYEMVADNIDDDNDNDNENENDKRLHVSIRKNGKEDFEAFIGELAASDAEKAEAKKKAETAEKVRLAEAEKAAETEKVREAEKVKLAKVAEKLIEAEKKKVKLETPVAEIDESEETLLLKAAALASIATAMAIASATSATSPPP